MSVVAERAAAVVPVGALAAALLAKKPLPSGTVGLSFDDGFASMARHVQPVLEKHGLPASLFQVAGAIGARFADAEVLSANALRELSAAGLEVGSHTVTHPHLDLVSSDRVAVELRDSRDCLEQILQSPIDGLAYPHGSHNRHVLSDAVSAGYAWAAGVKNAYSHCDDDPWAIARVTVTNAHTARDVERLLDGSAAPLAWKRERLRTRAFRVVRRVRMPEGYDASVR